MRLLVGTAVEVIRASSPGWHRAMVEVYDESTSMHFLVFEHGDGEWRGGRHMPAIDPPCPPLSHPSLPLAVAIAAMHSGYLSWRVILNRNSRDDLQASILTSHQAQLKGSLPGRPLAIAAMGDRLYAQPAECDHCGAPSTKPGGLLRCCRCARTVHAACVYEPGLQWAAAQASEAEEWVCDQCGVCDGCGTLCPSEIRAHWPAKSAWDLQGSWVVDAGSRRLCLSCAAQVDCGARCASTLQRWGAPPATAMLCNRCDRWSAPKTADAEPGGAPTPGLGVSMPPPPPTGSTSAAAAMSHAHIGFDARAEHCGRCEGMQLYWLLKDALDEVQGLDPLRYFADPVDAEAEPTYRIIIPDSMDFSTMKSKLNRGEYKVPKLLADDFALLCRNAIVFNTKPDNPFRNAARSLHKAGTAILAKLFAPTAADELQAEGADADDADEEDARAEAAAAEAAAAEAAAADTPRKGSRGFSWRQIQREARAGSIKLGNEEVEAEAAAEAAAAEAVAAAEAEEAEEAAAAGEEVAAPEAGGDEGGAPSPGPAEAEASEVTSKRSRKPSQLSREKAAAAEASALPSRRSRKPSLLSKESEASEAAVAEVGLGRTGRRRGQSDAPPPNADALDEDEDPMDGGNLPLGSSPARRGAPPPDERRVPAHYVFVTTCPPTAGAHVADEKTAEPLGEHVGMTCDRSGVCPIVGNRYHLKGDDYDLCQAEYDKLDEGEQAMYECIPPPQAAAASAGGSSSGGVLAAADAAGAAARVRSAEAIMASLDGDADDFFAATACVPALCIKCGSGIGSAHKAVVCVSCGEHHHRFCVGLGPPDPNGEDAPWRCSDCTTCELCERGYDDANLLLCECGKAFHTYCLRPPLKELPSGDWRCHTCAMQVRCERCHTQRPGRGGWQLNYRFCEPCFDLHQVQGYCNVCKQNCLEESGTMLCCDTCNFWVHAECDGISERGADHLTSRADAAPYSCPSCRGEPAGTYGACLETTLADAKPAEGGEAGGAKKRARPPKQAAASAAAASDATAKRMRAGESTPLPVAHDPAAWLQQHAVTHPQPGWSSGQQQLASMLNGGGAAGPVGAPSAMPCSSPSAALASAAMPAFGGFQPAHAGCQPAHAGCQPAHAGCEYAAMNAAPSQAYPPQAYPPQAYPPQTYPPQAYPPQTYPPQAYPPQAYPPSVMPAGSPMQVAPSQYVSEMHANGLPPQVPAWAGSPSLPLPGAAPAPVPSHPPAAMPPA